MRSGGFGFDRQFGFTAPAHEAAAPGEEEVIFAYVIQGAGNYVTLNGDRIIVESIDMADIELAAALAALTGAVTIGGETLAIQPPTTFAASTVCNASLDVFPEGEETVGIKIRPGNIEFAHTSVIFEEDFDAAQFITEISSSGGLTLYTADGLAISFQVRRDGTVNAPNLPTSDPVVAGDFYTTANAVIKSTG